MEDDESCPHHHSISPNYSAESNKNSQNWLEITESFTESVKDLQLGELLHDDLFGLFEAMSAIEMMDPKMDAGMLCNRGARKITSFEQAVTDGLLPLNDLPPTTLLGIIDGTLARLVSWLEGHSLAQTVFTCLYLHRPYAPQDRALKVFCLAVYKLLDVIKDLLHKAMVYEEEDFQPMQYGFHLNPDISEQRMIGMLREVEEELHRKARNKQCEPETQAIFARIKFIRIFLQVLNSLRKEDQQQNSLNDCQRLLHSGIEMLQTMKDTVLLGQGAKDLEEEMACFEPSINQRLLPPTFPRYTKIKKRIEAITHFTEMMERFKVVCKAQGLTTFHQAVELFADFSQSGPCLVSRSALQLVGRNAGSSREALREALRNFCGPHALSSRAIPAARSAADAFLARAARPAGLLLQLSGHNRARQRDKLAMLLEEFALLQEEAERADAACALALGVPPRPHFATWALYHTLRAQALYLLAGFELELYAEHEYYYIYWYLYECIYGWLISTLSRADSLLQEAWNGTAATASAGGKGGGRRQKPNKAAKRPRPHARDAVRLQALQQLAGGYFKALLGLLREGLLQAPLPGFDRERVRFEHRFSAFTRLPAPPSAAYRDFRSAAQAAGLQGSESLFLSAGRHFAQAGQLLAAGGPTEAALARTSKTNFVLLRLLAAGHRPKIKPTFCFNESRHFPVICLTEGQLTHE